MLLLNKNGLYGDGASSDVSSLDNPKTPQKIWETIENCQIPYKTFRGHRNGVTCCHFCMKDLFILSGSKNGNTQLWNASTGVVAHTYGSHAEPVTSCKVSSDDTKIISSSWDKTICYHDLETGNVLWRSRNDGIVMSCDLSPDGKCAVSCTDFENSLKIWDLRTGTTVKEIHDFHSNTPMFCVFSPNSQRIASCGMDRITKVWDLISSKTTVTLTGHSNIVSSCGFSPNERHLATTSWDKTLQLWDISTGTFRSQGSNTLDRGHDGSVSCCKFSQSGQLLISGGYDCSVVVWDVNARSKKITLKGHEGWVNGVDISQDGKWILSCSNDTTIRLWNIEGADHLPAVIEYRRAMGLKIVQCERCYKQFSLAQVDDPTNMTVCVFCRLADPERNTIPQLLPAFNN